MRRRWKLAALIAAVLVVGAAAWFAVRTPAVTATLRYGGLAALTAEMSEAFLARGHASEGEFDEVTKIVPIYHTGTRAIVGSAEVVGARVDVRQVQAVAAQPLTGKGVQGIALIPIRTREPGATPDEVKDVGVGAIVGFVE